MLSVEFVIVGAGPAGLCAAITLARAGREVLVLERKAEIGPKVCAGGLSIKSVQMLQAMGLPPTLGCAHIAQASFLGEKPIPLDGELALVRTIPRRALGQWQAEVTRAAGAGIRTQARVTAIDLESRCVTVNRTETIRYEQLIGADGSYSLVRRALHLPCARHYFAAEYNISGLKQANLLVAFDTAVLKTGYFWIFPHTDYTCIGCGADRRLVSPRQVCRYLDNHLRADHIDAGETRIEGCPIECEYVGTDFGNVHLIGDAAGLASPLSGEGIYPALASGEDIANSLLDPGWARQRLRRWLRTRALHARLTGLWRREMPRVLSYRGLRALCRHPVGCRRVSAFYLG